MQEVGRSSCVLSRGVGNAAKVKSAWIVAKCLGPPLGKAVQCDRWPRFALSAWKPPATADIAEKRHDQLYIYIYFFAFIFLLPSFLSLFLFTRLLCFLSPASFFLLSGAKHRREYWRQVDGSSNFSNSLFRIRAWRRWNNNNEAVCVNRW